MNPIKSAIYALLSELPLLPEDVLEVVILPGTLAADVVVRDEHGKPQFDGIDVVTESYSWAWSL